MSTMEVETLPNSFPQSFLLHHPRQDPGVITSDFSLGFNPDSALSISDFENRQLGSSPFSKQNQDQVDLISHGISMANAEKSIVVESSECTAAAVKVQKLYRSYRTRRRLADSAIAIEEYWSDLIDEYWSKLYDFSRLNHNTISFFDKMETPASRWNRVSKNASVVGKGFSEAEDDKVRTLAFQHWIEAIDPRHRYGHSLHIYYKAWSDTKAGQPFFYWLDIGDGRSIDLEACPRSKLRKQCIKYFGPQERERYEYIVVDGKIMNKQRREPLDTTKGSEEAKWIFVMSTCKKLYAGEKKKGELHHSSFLAGGVTLAAGRLVVVEGIVKSIWAYSGHYRPTDENLKKLLDFLKENGVNTDEVEIRSSTDDNEYNGDRKLSLGEAAKHFDYRRADSKPSRIEIPKEIKTKYQRTLSSGLKSPRAEMPEKVVLERINSKKLARSYQLGHQKSLKWSSGTGLRIGWVADNPEDLKLQALELVNLSPRTVQTPSSRQFASLVSPTSCAATALCNMETGFQPPLSG